MQSTKISYNGINYQSPGEIYSWICFNGRFYLKKNFNICRKIVTKTN
jgi:hypothetical protein